MFCVISCFDMNENMGLCWSCIDLAFNTFQLTSCIKTFCYKPHIKLIVLHVNWMCKSRNNISGLLMVCFTGHFVYTWKRHNCLYCSWLFFLCQNIKTNNRFFFTMCFKTIIHLKIVWLETKCMHRFTTHFKYFRVFLPLIILVYASKLYSA